MFKLVAFGFASCEVDAVVSNTDHLMLRPTHAKKQFKANRVFSGRKEERDLFSQACNQTDTKGRYKVLNWYGVGGQGKSSLLREFQRQIAAHNEKVKENKSGTRLIPAKIDFEDERLKRVDAALYSLRRQLAQFSGFAFHTFDAAFVAYHTKTRPGMDIGSTYPELFKGEKEGMMDLIDVLDDPLTVASHLASAALPGAGLIYKWGARLTGKLAKWWKTRGNELIAGIEALQPEQILEKLPTFLGIDLCDGIEAKPDRRPVVLLDTYEALWRNRGQKDGLADRRADAWVRLFIQDAPGALFVIAGRDKLRWSKIDDAWGEVVESRLLGALSDEDADQFLLEVPIVEDDVRAKIIDSSQGLPFYLDLQVSHYETLKEQGETPFETSFGGAPSDILARFLEHLSDNDQATLRLASYLQIITREAMDELVGAFPDRAINYSFDHMVARSSFVEISEGTYEIHALLKAELQTRELKEYSSRFKNSHLWLFQSFDARIDRSLYLPFAMKQDRIEAIGLAVTHLENSEPQQLPDWALSLSDFLSIDASWDALELVYERALEKSQAPDTEEPKLLTVKNNLAVIHYTTNRFAEGERLLEELFQKLSLCSRPASQLMPKVMLNLASVYFRLEKDEAAANLLQELRNLEIEGIGLDDASLFIIESTVARSLIRRGEYFEAEKLLRDLAFDAIASEERDSWVRAYSIQSLAHCLQCQQRFREAEPLSRFALGLFAPAYKSKSTALYDLGDVSQTKEPGFDGRADLISDGLNSEHLFRTVSMNFLPGVFNLKARRLLLNPLADDYEYSRFASNGCNLLTANWSSNYYSLPYHPSSQELKDILYESLSKIDSTGKFFAALRRLGVVVLIFEGEALDAYYHLQGNAIIVTAPNGSPRLEAVLTVTFFTAVYSTMMQRGGFVAPDMAFGLSALASFHHGAMLDTFQKICEAICEKDDNNREFFLSSFSDEFMEFYRAVETGSAREDLYTLYTNVFDALRGQKDYSM